MGYGLESGSFRRDRKIYIFGLLRMRNCLYLTIWDFLSKNEVKMGWKVPEQSEFRRDIVKYVTMDHVWNELEHVIIENLKTKLVTLKSVLKNDGKLFLQLKQEYEKYMNSDGICGTFVELIEATKIFRFIGVVLKENMEESAFDCYEVGTSDDGGAEKGKESQFYLYFSKDQQIKNKLGLDMDCSK